jgi:hypothetical protein
MLIAVFVGTRLVGAWLADRPALYRSGPFTLTSDVRRYEGWATAMVREGRSPYGDVRIEYPPGSLPFLLAPKAGTGGHAYRPRFVALMLLVDTVGLVGLVVVARRAGYWWGPWAWTVLVPLLGPIAYLRLDLVPAVATIWALERVHAGGWMGAGGWLGFGAAAKVYPGLLLPLVLVGRGRWRQRRRALAAAAGVATVAVLPFIGSLDGLWDSVVGYHSQRGLQVESTWGAALLTGTHLDRPVRVVFEHGAFHVHGPGASTLKTAALGLSFAVLAAGVVIARMRAASPDELVMAMAGTLALLLVVGTVFSPQFMLWLTALVAVGAALVGAALTLPLILLAVADVFSQALYPFHYAGLLTGRAGPLALLVARNAIVALVGALLLARLWRQDRHAVDLRGSPAPSARADARS